jgi:hypothetical protein
MTILAKDWRCDREFGLRPSTRRAELEDQQESSSFRLRRSVRQRAAPSRAQGRAQPTLAEGAGRQAYLRTVSAIATLFRQAADLLIPWTATVPLWAGRRW